MYILGIETSCDETAAAVIKFNKKTSKVEVLSNIISSQIEIHKKYGGVVPEVAAREHVLNILPVINESLLQANTKGEKIDLIAVTKGPGLITSLITGMETVRSLAFVWKKPIIEVNHIEGHIYSNFISPKEIIKFPALVLTVSGGHTTLLYLEKNGHIKILGGTRDDAAGEAFDKGAKMMNLEYPGGPIISQLAASFKKTKKNNKVSLPRPMIHSQNFDFSFSGLKTALLYKLKEDKHWKQRVPEYCQAYQQAIIDVLISKTIAATKKLKIKSVMLAGGVSANKELREQLAKEVKTKLKQVNFFVPDNKYTTDNAVMIAVAAAFGIKRKKIINFQNLRVDASLQLK